MDAIPHRPMTEERDSAHDQENGNVSQTENSPVETCYCCIKWIKKLIPLKAALFLWSGGFASATLALPFILGNFWLFAAAISEIAWYLSCVIAVGLVVSGIIADKIGSAKPVLLVNMFLSLLVLNILLWIPKNQISCMKDPTFELELDLAICDNHGFTFAMVCMLVLLYFSTVAISLRMFDAIAVSMVTTYNSDYGSQIAWSLIGQVIFISSSAAILSHTDLNFNIIIYFSDVAILLAMLAVWKLNIYVQAPGKDILRIFWYLIQNGDAVLFWIAILVFGICAEFGSKFTPLYLASIGAPPEFIHLLPAFSSLIGIPFLLSSKSLIKVIGIPNIIALDFIAYVLYYLGYAFIGVYWNALAIEITKIFSHHLLWVVAIKYCHEIPVEGVTASSIAFTGALYSGVSMGICKAFGETMLKSKGWVTSLIIMAGIPAVAFKLLRIFRGTFIGCTPCQSDEEPGRNHQKQKEENTENTREEIEIKPEECTTNMKANLITIL